MSKEKDDFFNEQIDLTENAVKRIKAILSGENKPDHGLRVSVVGGGCSGMSYNLSFDDNIGEFDKIRNHFGNSLLSQVAAIAAIKDQKYLSDVVKNISLGREKIYQIAKLNGLTAIPSATNFVAIDCGKDGTFATQVMNGLIEAKIF